MRILGLIKREKLFDFNSVLWNVNLVVVFVVEEWGGGRIFLMKLVGSSVRFWGVEVKECFKRGSGLVFIDFLKIISFYLSNLFLSG